MVQGRSKGDDEIRRYRLIRSKGEVGKQKLFLNLVRGQRHDGEREEETLGVTDARLLD